MSLSTVTLVGEEGIKKNCVELLDLEKSLFLACYSLCELFGHWFAFFERAQKPMQDYLTAPVAYAKPSAVF